MEAITAPSIGGLSLARPRVAASFSRVASSDDVAAWRRDGLEVAELRLDLAGVADARGVAALVESYAALPTLITMRAAFEGGRYDGDEGMRCALLSALPAGDAVDIELAAEILPAVAAAVKAQGKTLIVSRHNFAAADSAAVLDDSMAAALAAGADVFKCACLCTDAAALQVLQDFAARCRHAGQVCIVIGMDDGSGSAYARRARATLPRHGSCLAFAAVEQASAPGQLSLAETVAACRDGADEADEAGTDGAQ